MIARVRARSGNNTSEGYPRGKTSIFQRTQATDFHEPERDDHRAMYPFLPSKRDITELRFIRSTFRYP